MKTNNIKLLLAFIGLLLYTFLVACQNEKKVEKKQFDNSILNNLNIDETIKWIIVLPGLGCHGCIQEAESFMKEHIGNNDIIFVLTKISSLKILQQKININTDEYPNIFIDRKNVFNIPTNNSIYPCIIKMKNGYIITHEFQSPDNSQAFLKLKHEIIDYRNDIPK